MLGDIIQGLVEGYIGSRTPSPRWRTAARLFFGALGTALAVAGAVVIVARATAASLPLRLAMAVLFGAVASFFLFNVMLARTWRWPAVLFVLSFVLMFAARIVLGP